MKKVTFLFCLLFALSMLSSCKKDSISPYEQCVENVLTATGFVPYEGNVNPDDACQGVLSAYSFQGDYYFHDGYPCAFIWTPVLNCNAEPSGVAGDSIYDTFSTEAEFIEYVGVTE